MKINQIITENYNGEYDDEAGMAQTNLHTIARAAKGLLDTIDDKENLPEWVQEKIAKVEGMMVTAWDYLLSQEEQGMDPRMMEAANAAQQAAIAISMKKAHKKPKNESAELEEEFDLIESIIEHLAQHNGVDAEVIWEDLETLTEDELYAFAVTSEPIMESQGMSEGSEPDAYGRTGEKHECGSCDGTGIDTHDDECSECGGKGWVRDKESLKKQGVAEGIEGSVVFSGTGDNGGKYEIIQSGPNDFMIHANGKHIDSYDSLQRAMSVLQNEVPGLTKGVAEAKDKVPTPQQQAELRSQMDGGGEEDDARDRYGYLQRSTSPGLGGTMDIGGVDVPVDALGAGLGSAAAMGMMGGTKGMFGKPQDSGTTSRDIATQRNVGGNPIPSLSADPVKNKTIDNALFKSGKDDGGFKPTSKPGSTNVQLDPVVDVPAYVRQGKPEAATIPKPGTKPKIIIRPGETMNQALQRTKDEQEFGNFLKGQGGQKFGNPTTAQATSGAGQVPTIKLPDGSLIVDPSRLSPSGQYGRFDKIARDDDAAVNAMIKKARENAEARTAAQAAKEKQLGLEPGSLRPRSQWEKERDSALRSEEEKLGLLPGSLNPKPTEPKKPTTSPAEKSSTLGKIGKGLGYAAGAYGAAELGSQALDQVKEAKPRKEPEVDYDDEYQAMVARVRKLAGIGPMKTVWDPTKRVYKNVPTADQPQKK